MDRVKLITFFINKFNYKKYLEIGFGDGHTFKRINIESKVSVDTVTNNQDGPTFKGTSDEFFEQNTEKFDIVFIDGLHLSGQVDKDIKNSLNALSDNGTVVLHDCDPPNREKELAHFKFGLNKKFRCGDAWKSIVKFRSLNNGNGVVISQDMGLGIIRKGLNHPFNLEIPNRLFDETKESDWDWLQKNKQEALGVSSFEEVRQTLEKPHWWERVSMV